MKKHDLELVIVELERMSNPDFKLKATSKDLQSRILAIQKSADERQLVLISILKQWETIREKLRELLDWIDVKDLKLKELKEQVNLADEDEVKGELKELKVRYFPVLNSSGLQWIFGFLLLQHNSMRNRTDKAIQYKYNWFRFLPVATLDQ